ncbi:hypothetical protein B296_00036889, partial [Ensete ventricosum]
KWDELLLGQHEGALQVVDIFETAIHGGRDEQHAFARSGDLRLAGARLDDAAGHRVVRDECPSQRRLRGLRRRQPLLEHQYRVRQDPDCCNAVHGGEPEAAGRRWLGGDHELRAELVHGKAHSCYSCFSVSTLDALPCGDAGDHIARERKGMVSAITLSDIILVKLDYYLEVVIMSGIFSFSWVYQFNLKGFLIGVDE